MRLPAFKLVSCLGPVQTPLVTAPGDAPPRIVTGDLAGNEGGGGGDGGSSPNAPARERGYYSDYVLNPTPPSDGSGATGSGLSARTRHRRARRGAEHRRSPLASSFRPRASLPGGSPLRGAAKADRQQLLGTGATTRTLALSAQLDVPATALEPKVMSPFQTTPGTTPRKIEIERKKRLFAAQDITDLLLAEGVDYRFDF